MADPSLSSQVGFYQVHILSWTFNDLKQEQEFLGKRAGHTSDAALQVGFR